ncbi:putative invertase inhibitor [Malania oleifera]|uniref:putative invertase inhibitor n=1 Tax=Malania oleifera TaxID=397392 RepID=UPI0025AEC88B|nr:putative invertase inhibitor [Malania oleifera]
MTREITCLHKYIIATSPRKTKKVYAIPNKKMNRSFSPLLLSHPFILFFFFSTFHGVVTGSTLIQKTCNVSAKTDPNLPSGFCVTSLQAAPASECASLRGLGMISMRLAGDNATDTRCYITRLLKNPTLNPFARGCLVDCLDLYSDAIPDLAEAMKSYRAGRFDDANIQVSAVMDAASTCEDGFKERRGLVSPLTKRNNDLFKLSAITLSIMNLLP